MHNLSAICSLGRLHCSYEETALGSAHHVSSQMFSLTLLRRYRYCLNFLWEFDLVAVSEQTERFCETQAAVICDPCYACNYSNSNYSCIHQCQKDHQFCTVKSNRDKTAPWETTCRLNRLASVGETRMSISC